MEFVKSFISELDAWEMSLTMAVVMVIDIWSAVQLKVATGEGFISRRFFKGIIGDMLMLFTPILISTLHFYIDGDTFDISVQVLSLIVTGLYVAGTTVSILSNLSALYSPNKNFIVKFLYNIFKSEIANKLHISVDELDGMIDAGEKPVEQVNKTNKDETQE